MGLDMAYFRTGKTDDVTNTAGPTYLIARLHDGAVETVNSTSSHF